MFASLSFSPFFESQSHEIHNYESHVVSHSFKFAECIQVLLLMHVNKPVPFWEEGSSRDSTWGSCNTKGQFDCQNGKGFRDWHFFMESRIYQEASCSPSSRQGARMFESQIRNPMPIVSNLQTTRQPLFCQYIDAISSIALSCKMIRQAVMLPKRRLEQAIRPEPIAEDCTPPLLSK